MPDETTPPGPRGAVRRWRVGALAASAAVAVAAAGVTTAVVLTHHGTPSADPPVLRLVDQDGAGTAPAENTATVPGGPVRVDGELPAEPDRARVYRFDSDRAPRDRVLELADALGVDGEPDHDQTGWLVTGSGHTLAVRDGPGWRWELTSLEAVPIDGEVRCLAIGPDGPLCPPPVEPPARGAPAHDRPVEPPLGGRVPEDATPVPPDTPTGSNPPRGGPQPDPDLIRSAADPYLTALGLSGDDARIAAIPNRGIATVDPVVDGRPTSGMATELGFDVSGRLTDASGWLAPATAGAEYPLMSADETLSTFSAGRGIVDGATELVVTGARVGLLLSYDERGDALLVPAWIYDIRDGDPLTLVAVAPGFVTPGADQSGSVPGTGSGGGAPPSRGPSPADDEPGGNASGGVSSGHAGAGDSGHIR